MIDKIFYSKLYSSYLKIRLDVWVENFYTSLVVFVDPLFIFYVGVQIKFSTD
jgi:hypothetical protein